jgi:EmrB/QacA subfamily drug resistance transporter
VTLSDRDKQLTLVAAILGSFVALLDSTVVNVALPAIREDLGGGLQGQQWVVNAYLLFLGSLILIGGSLGDVFGERRMFLIGVGGFGAVSAVCAAAPSIEVLVGARALQGVFGALLTPASLALIIAAFPERERGGAIGTWTAYVGIAAVVGPLAGGWLVDALDWRWIFAINVPFLLVTLAIASRIPAQPRMVEGRRPDWVGAALCAVGLAGPTFGLIQQPEYGWGDVRVALPIVVGLTVFAAFIAWERRARDPMLPLGLFGRGNFAWGNVETLCVYGGLGAMFFALVLFLQQVAGWGALEAGLATLPTTIVMFAISRRVGALADRLGPRIFMGAGPLVAAAGVLLLLMSVDEDPSFAGDVLPGTVVFAFGLSVTVAPLTAAVLADAEEHNAGIASGVNNAVARVAGLLATAAIGAVVGGTLDLDGFRMAMAFASGLLAAGGAIGLLFIRNPRRETHCAECAGGQLAGAPVEAGQAVRRPVPAPAPSAPSH